MIKLHGNMENFVIHPMMEVKQREQREISMNGQLRLIYIYIGKPLVSCCTLTITIFFNHIHMQIMILGLLWWVDNWDMGCIGLIWWLSGKRMGILMVKLMAIRWDSIGEWMGTEGIYIMGFHMDIYTHIHLHIHVYIYIYIYIYHQLPSNDVCSRGFAADTMVLLFFPIFIELARIS